MILFTALIGPHFVDWTSYRETFEREASAYVGRPVSVDGKASVRLLPTPVVSFTDVHVGDAEAPDVEMERFRAEVELTPLLKGEVRVIQMAFERPVFRVDIAGLADKMGPFGGSWRLDPQRISLGRLEIDEGSAFVSDSRTGRSWRADGINAVLEADTLMGPGRLDADLRLDGRPMALAVAFGRLTPEHSVIAKASLRSPDFPVTLALDGTLHLFGDEPLQVDGTATIEGVPPLDSSVARTPWADLRASGGFTFVPGSLGIDKMQISYGALERPLILEASGTFDLGDAPEFDLSLAARQIDIDRALGGVEDPVAVDVAFAALLDAVPRIARPPLPGRFHLEAQGIVVGGSLIEGVAADLAAVDGGWEIENLSAVLPGETRIALDGTFETRPEAAFRGRARLASARPAVFAAWWRGRVGTAPKIGGFALESAVDLTRENQRFRDLSITTAAGSMGGTVDVRRFGQSDRLFVTVDLSADRADLVEARALAELLAAESVAGGSVEQMTLSLSADVLSAGGVEARSVVLEGGLENGRLDLRRLSVADLAGARIDALGSVRDPLGTPSGNIEASINAEDFGGAAEFIASFAPESALARHLRDVAPILSPMNAEVSATLGGAEEPLSLALTGSFGDTHATLQANGTGSFADLASLSGRLALHADGEDSAKVLRQLGLAPLALRSTPLRIDAEFDGALASAGRLTMSGRVAGVDLSYAAETSLREGGIVLAGEFEAKSDDIDQALLLAGVAVPGVGEGHPAAATGRLEYSAGMLSVALREASFDGAPVSGSLQATAGATLEVSGALEVEAASLPFLAGLAIGREPRFEATGWSDAPFAAPLPPDLALDFDLRAATLDLGLPTPATKASVGFALSRGVLQLDLTEAEFSGGLLKGTMNAALRDGEAEVSLRGGVRGADLHALVWEPSGLPIASGKLDLSFEAGGRGRSLAGIVATLGGNGSFAIEEGRLNVLNADALTAVMQAAEGEREPDEEKARETFAGLIGSGSFDFGRGAGSFSIADGAMEIPTVLLASGGATILAGARLDLTGLTLASDWVLRVGDETADAQPYVPVRFSGPIAAPERDIDLDPLINLLRSRFLQRQIEAIDALEAEQRRLREAARQAAADRRDLEFAPMPEPAGSIPAAESVPGQQSAPAEIEIGPDLPPPIELLPQAEPEPAPARPRRSTSRPAPEPQPLPDQSFDSQYRMLPNGTVVKIR